MCSSDLVLLLPVDAEAVVPPKEVVRAPELVPDMPQMPIPTLASAFKARCQRPEWLLMAVGLAVVAVMGASYGEGPRRERFEQSGPAPPTSPLLSFVDVVGRRLREAAEAEGGPGATLEAAVHRVRQALTARHERFMGPKAVVACGMVMLAGGV